MNLAVNARDAMPDGGQLDDRRPEPFERRRARTPASTRSQPGPTCGFTVSDTGTGMSREVAGTRVRAVLHHQAEGRGHGPGTGDRLRHRDAGRRRRVDRLGARGRARRSASTSRRPRPTRSGASRAASPTRPSANGETILLVEDEEIVREPARRILARHGYTVLAAANADEALAIVQEHAGPIDLLLTDVVMPGRSGKELSVEVVGCGPATKVLFMSGYSPDVIVHQGVLEEGVHLIEKPFSADDLLRKVREVLDGAVVAAGARARSTKVLLVDDDDGVPAAASRASSPAHGYSCLEAPTQRRGTRASSTPSRTSPPCSATSGCRASRASTCSRS